jgi:hypothetical protein
VNIVMIGDSNVGKTSYTCAMYHAMQYGAKGFTLRAGRVKQHRQLLSQGQNLLAGTFPPPSDRLASYELTLRYQGRDIMPVVWRDHRGGALYEPSATSRQTAELLASLRAADGFLLFGDASRPRSRSIQHAVTHLLRALPERRGRTTPLVLVLTKIDAVPPAERDLAALTAPFRPLLDAIEDATDLHVTVAPVACGPKPEGVLLPVHWCVCFGLVQRGRELADQAGAHLVAAQQAAERDTTWNRWVSALNDIPSQRAIALEYQQKALTEWANVMPLVGQAVHLLGTTPTLAGGSNQGGTAIS